MIMRTHLLAKVGVFFCIFLMVKRLTDVLSGVNRLTRGILLIHLSLLSCFT